MCSFKCSLHEVNKGEQTRVARDSRVTQQDQCYVHYSLAPLSTTRAIFWKKRNGFTFLLPANQCFSYLFNASTILFCTYRLPSPVKYYLHSQNLTLGKNFVMMTSVLRLSFNGS